MKVAIVTPTLHYGGGEKQVEFLALGLRSKGYLVTVYCFADEGEIADILRAGGVKVIRLYSRLLARFISRENISGTVKDDGVFRKNCSITGRSSRMLNECWSAARLFFMLLVSRPEVVHLYQNQTKMAILSGRAAGIKRIVYTETSHIGDWMSLSQISIMRFFWKLCDSIITLSETMRKHMVELKAADADKIYLVPTMLSFSGAIRGVEDGKEKETVSVGIIGRLTPEKGHIFFLKAASSILKSHRNVSFIIAGNGYLKDELAEAAKHMGLGGNLEFTGTFKDISDIMDRIDILVLSSLTEGLPLVLLEGMAYGKPIVATDVGGVNELVVEDKTGFIVAPKDPEALANAILTLADDPQRRKKFADEAAKRFKDKYSSETLIPVIESIYHKGRN
ncbi:MAG: glycosyltransferase family 4 protein [Candidatus Omnitrophica bacterium]|nr:glycosyltransferase family 4 protein [Candidatus Omnitrophota bacterium]